MLCLVVGLEARALGAQANGQAIADSVAGDSSEAEKLLEQGITLFRQAKYGEAAQVFERAFALNPTNDQIARFMTSANSIYAMQMLRSDDPKIAGVGRALLDIRRSARRVRGSDAERIKLAVDKAFAATDEGERLVTMLHAAQEFGRNLVPALVEKIASPEAGVRTQAFLWISKVELDAIPPLVACARHPNPIVRQNVAMLLGSAPLRHPFSLGTLQGMVESDSSSEVKQAAQDSVQAILRDTRQRSPRVRSAKEYHVVGAEILYLTPHRNPFAGRDYTPNVYRLEGESLVAEPVAAFQFSRRMAEDELVEALRLDPAFEPARRLRLANEVLQVLEYDDAVASAGSAGKGAEELKALLESQKPMFDLVRRMRIRGQPKDVIFGALEQSLTHRRAEVAEKLIEIIEQNELRGEVPQALVAALTYPGSRLTQIAAASAIARWNPEDPGDLGATVVGTLTSAAVNSGVRTVHRVMGNRDNATRFEAMFRDLNLESGSNVPDVTEALERTIGLPPDLIVIDEEAHAAPGGRERQPVNAFVGELRKAYRTTSTPVVVVVEPAKLEEKKGLYASPERKVMVVPSDTNAASFRTQVLEPLFAQSDDAKARATRLAARAAQGLAMLTASTNRFPVAQAIKPLLGTLQGRPDEVRIPVLTALGNLRGAARSGLAEITSVYANAESSPGVRLAAMTAIGLILTGSEVSAPKDVMKQIISGLDEADPKLREASFVAFGAARPPAPEYLQVLTFNVKVPAGEAKAAGAEAKAGEEAAGDAPKAEEAKPEAEEKAEGAADAEKEETEESK